MTKIGVYQAKMHMARLLNDVEQGANHVITRHGHPIARLIPADVNDRSRIVAIIDRMKACRSALPKMPRGAVLAAIHDGHKY